MGQDRPTEGSMTDKSEHQQFGVHIALDAFLDRLDPHSAAEARAAAGRMDELERVAQDLEGVERTYLPWAIGAVGLFIASGVLLLSDSSMFRGAQTFLGPVGLAGMAAALPILGIVYTFQVRGRTNADAEKFSLNKEAFAPHGGIYFPAPDGGVGTVYLTDPNKMSAPKDKKDDIRAGRIW